MLLKAYFFSPSLITFHTCFVKGQWRNGWLIFSSSLIHNVHILLIHNVHMLGPKKLLFLRLSQVSILPFKIIHVNILLLCGAKSVHVADYHHEQQPSWPSQNILYAILTKYLPPSLFHSHTRVFGFALSFINPLRISSNQLLHSTIL